MNDPNWTCSLQELASATGGQILSQVVAKFTRVGTDTREDLSGKLYIPLKGEKFDGHDFVVKAVEQKAQVILVQQWRDEWTPFLSQVSFVRVKDTLLALQSLARYWRKKCGFKVLAITGSNGKTSTKEFLHAILKSSAPTHSSVGSYNNHWGVPRTLLDADPHHKFVVVEMGMNHAGEIWRLCQIAEPDVVAVTTVGRAHIGELGSQENIAKAKEEIYTASPKAVHVINMDNEWTMRMQTRSQARQIRFSSFKKDVEVHLRAQRISWEGLDITGTIQGSQRNCVVQILGRQNTVNIMCACALALAAGLSPDAIWNQLPKLQNATWGRNQLVAMHNGGRVLFDAYNANPDSLQAMLKNVYEIEPTVRKYLVLGDMRELGAFTDAAHEEAGERAGNVGFTGIYYIGKNAAAFERGLKKVGVPETYVATPEIDLNVAKEFAKGFTEGDIVAVKASRGMHLETLVESWPLKTPLGKKP